MATTRKRSTTTRRRTTRSSSPLDDILGGIAGTSTRRRRRKPTIGSFTGGAAKGSLLLTLAAICFAVGYYVPQFEWLIFVGIGLGVIYLIVAYFSNRKKSKKEESEPADESSRADEPKKSAAPAPTTEVPASHLSASQRAQIQDRLRTLPELQQLHPQLADAAKVVVYKHSASVWLLTTVLKLNDSQAASVLHQLELMGMIGAAGANGEHCVYVNDEAELAEWINLIFES